MKTKRNSNIELLRIISIIMITLSHYSTHNGINNYLLDLGINRFILEFISLGNLGVIIFVLITGYFAISKEQPFKLKKLFNLYMQVSFYSIIIYIIFILSGLEKFSLFELIKCFFPIAFKKYWFISVYVVLYIFTPYINRLLLSLKKKEHLNMIIISLLIFSILHIFTGQDYYGNELIQLILFYIIGAYLGKYKSSTLNNNSLKILVITTILMISSVIIFDLIGTKYTIFGIHSTYLMNRTSILSILFSISLFNIFNNRKECSKPFINKLSSCVLGVYLISDNQLIRGILWTDILNVQDYVNSNALVLHIIVSIILVFLTCIIIEHIRKETFGRLSELFYDLISQKIVKMSIYKKLREVMYINEG